jgi:hypothetical protein
MDGKEIRMQDDSNEFRRYAKECLRLAEQVQSVDDKAVLLTMAEAWVRLADQRSPSMSGENGSRTVRETG